MGRIVSPLLLSLLLLATALAGCADDGGGGTGTTGGGNEPPSVVVTETTGGIRGVVVDEAVVPIATATATIQSTGDSAQSDENGAFVFSGLEAGNYFVTVVHPLYDSVQQSVEVVAGVENPPVARFQLTRVISSDPYISQQQLRGYISCSANVLIPGVGGVLSEECGEGVGVPGVGRVGGNAENQAQLDFNVDSGLIKSLVVEAVWDPSLSVGTSGSGQSGGFNMGVYIGFSCDPVCSWDTQIDRKDGMSPMYLRNDDPEGFDGDTPLDTAGVTADTTFSTFTWASSDETGLLLEQEFEVFITSSYVLELPEGWSLVNGDPNPF